MTIAIVREPSASLAACQLSFVPREAIDLTLARSQHAAYTAALREAGCRVLELPAEDALPDAVFVEDVALVLDEVAVMTRPGAPSRRAEGAAVAAALAPLRPLVRIAEPGTLDGGDVMRVGRPCTWAPRRARTQRAPGNCAKRSPHTATASSACRCRAACT